MTLQRYLPADALQVTLGIVCLAVVVVANPVEYEDFSQYAPASVQYQHAAPLVKHLVVEKYVSLKCYFVSVMGNRKGVVGIATGYGLDD
jgi:hypothetical protein